MDVPLLQYKLPCCPLLSLPRTLQHQVSVTVLATTTFSLLGIALSSPTTLNKRVPAGFVTTNGRGFELDGDPYFAGTNAYWATGLNSDDLASLFSQMNSAGLKVLRILAQ